MTIYPVELTEEEYNDAAQYVNEKLRDIELRLDAISVAKYGRKYGSISKSEKAALENKIDYYHDLVHRRHIYRIFQYILDETGDNSEYARIKERYDSLISDECKQTIESIEAAQSIDASEARTDKLEEAIKSVIRLSILKDAVGEGKVIIKEPTSE